MRGVRTGERKGVDILAVVTASHELLAETDSVLALGNVVEHLELLLRDALGRIQVRLRA